MSETKTDVLMIVMGIILFFGGLLVFAFAAGCEFGRSQARRRSSGVMVMSTQMADDYDPPSGSMSPGSTVPGDH